jgi:hypothetical protein
MRLLVAWLASALAGAVAEPIGRCIAFWLLGGAPWGWGLLTSILRMVPYVFVACLVIQLVYGGILYMALTRLSWFNLPVVLLAYVLPVVAFAYASDTPKDAIMAISYLTLWMTLAIVGWLLAR